MIINKIITKPTSEYEVGETYSENITITSDLIEQFAHLTGDYNPLHLDDAFAKQTFFGAINAQGQLLTSMVVGLIGSSLPGAGWYCLGVDSSFNNPVFSGDSLEIRVTVKTIVMSLDIIVLEGVVTSIDSGEICLRSTIKTKKL